MEGYLLHEIGKIGTLLRALLVRIGLAKKEPEEEIDGEQLRTDLLNRIDTDLDSLLAEPDFIAALTGRCGFDDGQLVRFADLLVDLVAASDDPDERLRLAGAVGAVCRHLDAKRSPLSRECYPILKELDRLFQEQPNTKNLDK